MSSEYAATCLRVKQRLDEAPPPLPELAFAGQQSNLVCLTVRRIVALFARRL
jgi:hypothetical protein